VAADFLVIFKLCGLGVLDCQPDGTFGPRMVLKMVLPKAQVMADLWESLGKTGPISGPL